MTPQESTGNNPKTDIPAMTTLTDRINKATRDGYTDNLKMTRQGLYSATKDKTYSPADTHIIDFYRFEGQSDPADNSIMYVIETDDGVRGILVDAYGAYADENVVKFISEVPEINKKIINQ